MSYDPRILPFGLSKLRTSGNLETGVEVGHKFFDGAGEFQVVKFKTTPGKGDGVCYYHSAAVQFVTDNTNSAPARFFAGVVQASGVAAGNYGWIQTKGYGRVPLNVTGTVNANTMLSISGTTGEMHAAATTSAGNYLFVGARALQAKSGTQVKAGEYVVGLP